MGDILFRCMVSPTAAWLCLPALHWPFLVGGGGCLRSLRWCGWCASRHEAEGQDCVGLQRCGSEAFRRWIVACRDIRVLATRARPHRASRGSRCGGGSPKCRVTLASPTRGGSTSLVLLLDLAYLFVDPWHGLVVVCSRVLDVGSRKCGNLRGLDRAIRHHVRNHRPPRREHLATLALQQ